MFCLCYCCNIGPPFGSILYEEGGFILPYEVVGSIALVMAIVLLFVLPSVKTVSNNNNAVSSEKKNRLTFAAFIKVLQLAFSFDKFNFNMPVLQIET